MNRICPHCGAYARAKAGITSTGYQRYKCSACGKYSTDDPIAKSSSHRTENVSRICPHCNVDSRQKIGFTKKTGYQRYKCSSCGKYSSDSPLPKGSSPIGDQPKPKSIIAMRSRAKVNYQTLMLRIQHWLPDSLG